MSDLEQVEIDYHTALTARRKELEREIADVDSIINAINGHGVSTSEHPDNTGKSTRVGKFVKLEDARAEVESIWTIDRIVHLLEAGAGMTKKQLCSVLGLNENAVESCLRTHKNQFKIVRNTALPGHPLIYSLKAKGK